MNVSEQIISVINALCEKFGVAIDWTSETVIPYVEQLCQKFVAYEIWTSVATIILMWVIFAALLIITLVGYKKANAIDWGYNNHVSPYVAIIGTIITVIFTIVAVSVTCVEIMDIITCLTFPEKQIFEYAKGLLSN